MKNTEVERLRRKIARLERSILLQDQKQHEINQEKSELSTVIHKMEGMIADNNVSIGNNNKHITFITNQISKHNALYNQAQPIITDAEFDKLKQFFYKIVSLNDKLYELNIRCEKLLKYTNNKLNDINLFSIGIDNAPISKFQKIDHLSPMLSLGNVFDEGELDDFLKRINNFLNTEEQNYEFTAEKKIDGVSFSALYKKGKLVHVLTRGDGTTGENITENILTIKEFPQKIELNQTLEVRGEVYILTQDFEKLNTEDDKIKHKIFANPRNAASGSLRQLDATITAQRNLQYFAYSLIFYEEHNLETQGELYEALAKNGFVINDYHTCKSTQEMLAYYNSVAHNRFQLGYDIDGIVYKINSLALQKRLGSTANAPRWAVAHKFSSKKGQTKVERIITQVGRTGIITPVAELLPINLGGVIVKRATLHNKDEIHRLGINIGDVVEIERAGDVIPKILKVVEKHTDDTFKFPKNCPCCGMELVQTDTLIRCTNTLNCKEQIIGRMQYFVSKECFNIVGLGEKQIEEFYNKGIVQTYADIFTLPQKIDEIKLYEWEGWGKVSTKNLLNSIEKSKIVKLSRLICSLGIYTVGAENAKILAGFFKNAKNLLDDIQTAHLITIDGIGEKTAKEVILFLQKEGHEVQKLLNFITIENEPIQKQNSKGTVLFTGTLSISRAEAKELAENSGYSIVSSISKNVNLLVAGIEAGSKLKKAQELGIKILTEEEFIKMVSNNTY
jgi:DNA ligase (NAD+)